MVVFLLGPIKTTRKGYKETRHPFAVRGWKLRALCSNVLGKSLQYLDVRDEKIAGKTWENVEGLESSYPP